MTVSVVIDEIKTAVRDIPDFPKKGILFKDITPILGDPALFRTAIDTIADHYRTARISKVACVEARGFMFGPPVAYSIGAGIILVRKRGKLPYKTVSHTYQLEYGTDTLEMHEDAVRPGERILLVDDLLATGGTALATATLLKSKGAEVVGAAFLIELLFLKGRATLKDFDVFSVVTY